MAIQVFDNTPTESTASMIGKALGEGLGKRMAISDAENAFQQADGNPLKLATAMARLVSASPDLGRAAGPMYDAMLRMNQAGAAGQQYAPGTREAIDQVNRQRTESPPQEAPDLTTREAARETIRPALPMTRQQKMQRGVELFQENPQLYQNDINNALAAAEEENTKNLERSRAIQASGQSQQVAQQKIKDELRNLNDKFGGGSIVPENVYNKIQNQAIESMLPVEEGGQGLTQQEASQKYIKQLDEIARDYQALDDLGDWTFVWESPASVQTNLKNSRKKFKERGDLENFADYLVGHNDLSPRMAYSQAYPVNEDPKVYSELKGLKKLDPILSTKNPTVETKKISESLAKRMDKNSSPLSIAQYLQRKGYDPQPFLNYLVDNQDQLGLTAAQVRQLSKGSQVFPKINDLYLMSQIGVE